MAKKGLALGGGGAKGSYQMGVWKALREAEMEFDIIVGTSIGSLNGAMMTQNDFEAADELWNTIEYEKLFGDERKGDIRDINSTFDMVKFAVNDAILEGRVDSAPLEKLIKEAINEKAIRNSETRFGLVTVELPILRAVTPMIEDIPKGDLYRWLMASSACFPVFSPYDIGGFKYIDGGYYDNVPINLAIEQGASDIIAVDLDGVGFVKQPKLPEDAKVTRIYSHWDLGAVFDFDQNVFARNRKLGYFETIKAFGEKEGHYYTFSKGEIAKNYAEITCGIEPMRERISQLLRRPVARTITVVERDEALEMLSGLDWETNAPELLCRIAEIAGTVYGVSPEREYTFEQFNDILLEKFGKIGGLISISELLLATEDIRHAMTEVLKHKETRNMSAAITRLMQKNKFAEAIRVLSTLIPREYIAAEYINILLNNKRM